MKKVLVSRYGGMGDVAPVMVVCEQLKQRGWHVTVALRHDGPAQKQTELLENTNCFDEALDLFSIGPWGTRSVSYKDGYRNIESIYDDYDWVLDYMFIIEANNTCRSTKIEKATDTWQKSRNSNWQNWYDLHLAWANINPRSVLTKDKRPKFRLSKDEEKESDRLRKKYKTIITLQPFASSLARTWYQARELVPMFQGFLGKPYLIAYWNPVKNEWTYVSHEGEVQVDINVESPLRRTMTLVHASDLFIGADTGTAHFAEGLNRRNIVLYSTVPSWTRAEYYKYQTPFDDGIEHPEYHTFVIDVGDPLRIEEGMNDLSKREKKLYDFYNEKAPIEKVLKELNTDTGGVEMELQALRKKIESFSRQQSKALTSVTPEMVFDKAKELLKK